MLSGQVNDYVTIITEAVLMHLLVLGAFWPPASGSGVVAPLPGAGAPPAPQVPRGAGRHCPYLTTFRRPDAKRHRRYPEHLQPPASNDVKPKGRRSRLWLSTRPASVVGRVGLQSSSAGVHKVSGRKCLDAPSGARCFLAPHPRMGLATPIKVLMHLLVLGAFWP